MYHGFRLSYQRHDLKYKKGYLIPATQREDSEGIDLWVKMPRDKRIIPVQVTQRGVRMYRKYHNPSAEDLKKFIDKSQVRIKEKMKRCFRHGIAFALVRDFNGKITNPTLAWGDIKSLRYAITHLNHH